MNAPARDKLIAKVPRRRTGRPDDIADAAAYLCSSAAGYVSGVVLDADGGLRVGPHPLVIVQKGWSGNGVVGRSHAFR